MGLLRRLWSSKIRFYCGYGSSPWRMAEWRNRRWHGDDLIRVDACVFFSYARTFPDSSNCWRTPLRGKRASSSCPTLTLLRHIFHRPPATVRVSGRQRLAHHVRELQRPQRRNVGNIVGQSVEHRIRAGGRLALPRWPLQIPPSVAGSNSPRADDRKSWIVTRNGYPWQGGWRLL